jgi:hypothetical protein
MSSLKAHPLRESKIIKWVAALSDGEEFLARQIAKDLDLMGVKVGNVLKYQPNVRIVRKQYMQGTVWQKVPA